LYTPIACRDVLHTSPRHFPDAACFPSHPFQCSVVFVDGGSRAIVAVASKWIWENQEGAPAPNRLMGWRAGTLESRLFPGSYLFGSSVIAPPVDPFPPMVVLEAP